MSILSLTGSPLLTSTDIWVHLILGYVTPLTTSIVSLLSSIGLAPTVLKQYTWGVSLDQRLPLMWPLFAGAMYHTSKILHPSRIGGHFPWQVCQTMQLPSSHQGSPSSDHGTQTFGFHDTQVNFHFIPTNALYTIMAGLIAESGLQCMDLDHSSPQMVHLQYIKWRNTIHLQEENPS